MAITKKKKELQRLRKSFEEEAEKFHDINFSVFYLIGDWVSNHRKFNKQNHTISLWQYYGKIDSEESKNQLANDVFFGRTKFGVKGAKFSSYGVIEGDKYPLFIRMAKRAGNLFSDKEIQIINDSFLKDINDLTEKGKPVFISNGNPLAVWLSFLLYHLSISHPRKFEITEINIDPFETSLNAVEQLLVEPIISRSKNKTNDIENRKFKVALSFPGEKREFVRKTSDVLKANLGTNEVFYDMDFQAQLARPNLDVLLQKIYHKNSKLIVVFLCEEYSEKDWCGLEWRAIRDLIKSRNDKRIMFMRFDDTEINGTFSIDGYVSLKNITPSEAANLIIERFTIISDSS